MDTGCSPTENRGGKRSNAKYDELHQDVVEFMKTFAVRQPHYEGKRSTRQYLAPELNIEELYRLWCKKREFADTSITPSTSTSTPKKAAASLAFFKKIFYSKFNLGFGVPASDICSKCLEFDKKIADKIDIDENVVFKRWHLKKADKFYELMKKSRDTCDTLCLVFDMMQNQPVPKCGVGDEYYRRQLWCYNLAFVIYEPTMPKKNIFFYVWNESESGKGSSEVCSVLANCLQRLKKRVRKQLSKFGLVCRLMSWPK